MIFETNEQRDAYFQCIEADPFAVEYGDALRQAEAQLGPWGSEDDLFDDCSRIMLAEVNKFASSRYPISRYPKGFCRICDIQLSVVWHVLFNSAQAKPRRNLSIVYEELGEANDNESLMEEAAKLKTRVVLSDMPPYQMVYEDIKRKGLIPDGSTFIHRNPSR